MQNNISLNQCQLYLQSGPMCTHAKIEIDIKDEHNKHKNNKDRFKKQTQKTTTTVMYIGLYMWKKYAYVNIHKKQQ